MIDYFISYTKTDLFQARIIYSWLIDEGYTCKMQDSDFHSGSNFVLEMQKATQDCQKTIALLSLGYLESSFTQPEWAAAFVKDPTGENRTLIPVRIKECKSKGLLASIVYIDLVGLDAVTQREKLLNSLKNEPISLKMKKGIDLDEQKKNIDSPIHTTQSLVGNNNIQVGRDYNVYKNTPRIKIQPSKETIGGEPLLQQRIQTLFNKIGEARESRFGKRAYGVMYNKFKTDFGIKNNPWTVIWNWPKECAPEIVSYLEAKFDNTVNGRIEKASKRSDYIHTRPQLYKKEKELLNHLGLELDSDETRNHLEAFFGTRSHKDLTHLEHWQWVTVLEKWVSDLEK